MVYEGFHVKPEFFEGISGRVERQLECWGVSLGGEALEAMGLYVHELASYEKANVIGTRDVDELWADHILDSLSCLLYKPLWEIDSLVDVGAGGGLPGLPLHFALGFERLCLLESVAKKVEFLRQVSIVVSSTGLEAANYRAEDFGRSPAHRASFEAATVRAVAPLDVLTEYCMPLLTPGGVMVAMKGRRDEEELEAGKRASVVLGGELEEVIRVPISPEMEQKERHLVIIRKVAPTSDRYPRKPGIPRKRPLGAAA